MRVLANSVDGRDAQETMLRMAQHYDRLATKAELESQAPGAVPPLPAASEFAWWLTPPNATEAAG